MGNFSVSNDRIVLFAKPPAITSFSSLFTIKHAFQTHKVGHTGTLDSFASGLLVVCCGSLTRLAGRITEFNKTYEAVIKFGEETDTLECTGNVVRTAPLPTLEELNEGLSAFTGQIMQKPPLFSALHVNGQRASDAARSGKTVDIPSRPVTVFSSKLLEVRLSETQDGEKYVESARVSFSVSKGTYIRSLARDIALYCGSAGYLVGLRRTQVGNFKLEDAAGSARLSEFTIENAFKDAEYTLQKEKQMSLEKIQKKDGKIKKEKVPFSEEELSLQAETVQKSVEMSQEIAALCGFRNLVIKNEALALFKNGAKLHSSWFSVSPFEVEEQFAAIFTEENHFAGMLEKGENGYFKYSFVVH
ncbi:MAG: tRNA pseudouridine(55) synthase TruB [Treponema sp.]|nr:tRNA pseudouridine(55) synthase TruB [Treponema sp.]